MLNQKKPAAFGKLLMIIQWERKVLIWKINQSAEKDVEAFPNAKE